VKAQSKLFAGLQVGEVAACVPIQQGKSTRATDGFTRPHQNVTLAEIEFREIERTLTGENMEFPSSVGDFGTKIYNLADLMSALDFKIVKTCEEMDGFAGEENGSVTIIEKVTADGRIFSNLNSPHHGQNIRWFRDGE